MRKYLIQSEASHGLARLKGLDEIPTWIRTAILLYNRCLLGKEIELPCLGSLDEQPELIMRILEIISEERNSHFVEKQEKVRREIEQSSRKRSGWKKFFRR